MSRKSFLVAAKTGSRSIFLQRFFTLLFRPVW
jgi:hypothetical protein